jgi:hypothetical protein
MRRRTLFADVLRRRLRVAIPGRENQRGVRRDAMHDLHHGEALADATGLEIEDFERGRHVARGERPLQRPSRIVGAVGHHTDLDAGAPRSKGGLRDRYVVRREAVVVGRIEQNGHGLADRQHVAARRQLGDVCERRQDAKGMRRRVFRCEFDNAAELLDRLEKRRRDNRRDVELHPPGGILCGLKRRLGETAWAAMAGRVAGSSGTSFGRAIAMPLSAGFPARERGDHSGREGKPENFKLRHCRNLD